MTEQGRIGRRRLLAGAGALGVGSLVGTAPTPRATGTASAPADRPNIVVIVADDLGYSDVGCFGAEIATPNLDGIAGRGMRMTQMYTNGRCCPTRASLLTGLYPTQSDLGHMIRQDMPFDGYRGRLNLECVTLAEVLGAAGYRTGISGKWHLCPWGQNGTAHLNSIPHTRGFERAWSPIGGSYYAPSQYQFPKPAGWDDEFNGPPADDDFFTTNRIANHTIASLREYRDAGAPFFHYVTFTAPHNPLQAREWEIDEYRGRYQMGWDELREQRHQRQLQLGVADPNWTLPVDPDRPSWAGSDQTWENLRMAVYAAQIAGMDRNIGRILTELDTLGLAANTLVLFLGDNGGSNEELPGNDGGAGDPDGVPRQNPGPADTNVSYGEGWAYASDTPFRKYKRWTHEGAISTPCVASWPGVIDAGRIDHRPLHVMDLMPTFVEMAGAGYPSEVGGRQIPVMQGESFVDVLDGTRGPEPDGGRALFWEHEGNRALRQGRWKLVSEFDPVNNRYGAWELYDMVADRTESDDLAAGHPDMIAEMSTAWQLWKERTGVADFDAANHIYLDPGAEAVAPR